MRGRVSQVVLVGENRLIRPHRFPGDEQLLACVAALGYPDADVYRVPTAKLGHDATFIAFAAGTDGRARARSLIDGAAPLLTAQSSDYVAFSNVARIKETAAQRYDWAYWRTPMGTWLELEATPREHLARIASEARARQPMDHTLTAAALLAQARIEVSYGRSGRAAPLLNEALAVIRAAPAVPGLGAPVVQPQVHFAVLQELLRDAAERDDEAALDQLITSTAELGARLGVDTAFAPVRRRGLDYPRGQRGSGTVQLRLTVLPDGRVENPVLVSTDMSDDYVRAGMKTVLGWRFMPATRDGKAVAAPWQVTSRHGVDRN